jgi:hypothetical protein
MKGLVLMFHGLVVYGRMVWLAARAILRAAREADGLLDFYDMAGVIRDAWPEKDEDGAPLPIRMPWYRGAE